MRFDVDIEVITLCGLAVAYCGIVYWVIPYLKNKNASKKS